MKFYRGDASEEFKVKRFKTSRYGFNALFFTTNIEVARLYASHRAKEEGKYNGGFVYEFELPEADHIIDYQNKITYSPNFRNLMYTLNKTELDSVYLENTFDYPSKELIKYIKSDLLVIFNLDLIKKYKLIESNIK